MLDSCSKMRRLLSLALLVVFGLLTVAPMFGLASDSNASLPACCRRNGIHHCGMSTERTTSTHSLTSHCSSFPQAKLAGWVSRLAVPVVEQSVTDSPLHLLLAVQRAETQRLTTLDRSRHKRGPPVESL